MDELELEGMEGDAPEGMDRLSVKAKLLEDLFQHTRKKLGEDMKSRYAPPAPEAPEGEGLEAPPEEVADPSEEDLLAALGE